MTSPVGYDVSFAFDDEQIALRSVARRFLASHSTPEQVRAAMASEIGYDAEVWRRVATELGWPALVVPEEYGGLGMAQLALAGLMEEQGQALFCSPFFATVCLATNALLIGGSAAQKGRFLPEIATGTLSGTVAFTEANGSWGPDGTRAVYVPTDSGYRLSGEKTYVLDGAHADLVIVSARQPGTTGAEGLSLFGVDRRTTSLEATALPTMDMTRRQATISLDGVELRADALIGAEGRGASILERTLALAAIALAAEQTGGAQRCLDTAVAYAKTRVQFGRPIGAFQAIKHKCADMMVLVESARSAAYYAAQAVDDASDDVAELASVAKAYCSDAFFRCAADSIQIHGGIGFTWEHEAHLYFKRAQSTRVLLGSASYHRERVARLIGITPPAEVDPSVASRDA